MNNTMYTKDELYKIALSNVHRYALLNEIFAIKDERFPKEQRETMLCVNGYIGINTLDRYVRHINELVKYQDIGTIENFKQSQQEIDRLNNIINELEKYFIENFNETQDIRYCDDLIKLNELKEGNKE